MTGHDPLCPNLFDELTLSVYCLCDLIAKVRADERTKADRERKREVEATAKWCREDERETIAAAIEAAHKAAPDCGPCAYEQAARIARSGGRDE